MDKEIVKFAQIVLITNSITTGIALRTKNVSFFSSNLFHSVIYVTFNCYS